VTSGAAELVVLGAGSALPRAGYGPSGYALRPLAGGPWTLLDCGPGTVRTLGAVGIDLTRVRRVVFSHYHPDHCLDLLALFFARRNPALGSVPELELFGPPGLQKLVERAPETFGSWVEDPRATARELPFDGARQIAFERPDLAGRGFANGHTPHAVSWRFELPSGTVLCYSGDSGDAPGLRAAAAGADLFLCECSFADEAAVPHHLTPTSAATVARDARARQLLLTHFYPELDPAAAVAVAARTFAGPVRAVRDGWREALP
jgi:ribonuclease BN (tRNA processing enzyme)